MNRWDRVVDWSGSAGVPTGCPYSPVENTTTVPRDNYPRAAGGDFYRLHRRALDTSDVTEVDGIPTTAVARTIRDCLADGTDPYQLRLAINCAEAEGLLRRKESDELREELTAAGVVQA